MICKHSCKTPFVNFCLFVSAILIVHICCYKSIYDKDYLIYFKFDILIVLDAEKPAVFKDHTRLKSLDNLREHRQSYAPFAFMFVTLKNYHSLQKFKW